MQDENDRREAPGAGNPKPGSRQDRLKLALRENLKRRKSQARGRSDVATPGSDTTGMSPHQHRGTKPDK